jgi:hypothetical protein
MKDHKKGTAAVEDKQTLPEEQITSENLSANAEGKSDHTQPVNGKMMATHGFLRILATVRKR